MRRFPPPWTIEEHNSACFIVRDNTGQALGYFYFEDEPRRRSAATVDVGRTCDEAWRLAGNFAKLPELLRKPQRLERRFYTGVEELSLRLWLRCWLRCRLQRRRWLQRRLQRRRRLPLTRQLLRLGDLR